ncbi:MAG: hypothetical protein OQK12_06765, partial [Motiliproteus sp.]|nr:hypothetical protein [Motiliproteus sp.]
MPNDQLKSNFVDVFDAASTSLAIIEQQPDDQFYLINSNHAFNRLPVNPGTDWPCLISTVFDSVQTALLDSVMAKALQSGFPEEVELALDCEEDLQWWRMVASPFSDVTQGNARILLSCYDITVKKRLDLNRERVLSRMEQIVDSAYDGMLIFDRDLRVEYSN